MLFLVSQCVASTVILVRIYPDSNCSQKSIGGMDLIDFPPSAPTCGYNLGYNMSWVVSWSRRRDITNMMLIAWSGSTTCSGNSYYTYAVTVNQQQPCALGSSLDGSPVWVNITFWNRENNLDRLPGVISSYTNSDDYSVPLGTTKHSKVRLIQ